jgi:hypothetical protein
MPDEIETTTRTVDLTPAWAAIVRPMLEAYAHNMRLQALGELTQAGADALDGLREEFLSMAQAADKWNAHARERQGLGRSYPSRWVRSRSGCPDCGHPPHKAGQCAFPTIGSEGACDCE